MSTTIEQIRKVNVYEEDEKGKRTLVQKDVPLGSNVVLEKKVPENKELNLLVGEKDVTANKIKLYPTSITVSSDGKINATDLLINSNSINGKFISNIYWGEEDSSTTPPVRRLYYKINDNSFQVKNSGGTNALNLLQVPYLELYSTNTIKTTDSTDPLYLNVDNVTSTHLAKNTKVVLGKTAIKDSSLDLVDNGRNYLGARLGIDMREDYLYGYLNFYKTVKDGKNTKNYEIGSIFASGDDSLCIMPRKIYYKNINEPETNKDGSLKETLPVIAGSVGASQHKFKDMWAENLHGNITPTVYTGAATTEGDKYLKTYTNQLIYIDPSRGNSIKDLPDNSKEGFCFTLSASATNTKFKQIFLNTEINNDKNKYIYIRTGQKDSTGYENWHKIGISEWIDCKLTKNKNIPQSDDDYKKNEPCFIFSQQYLDVYKNNRLDVKARGISLENIKKEVKKAKNNLYYKHIDGINLFLVFGYRSKGKSDYICLWGGYSSSNKFSEEKIQFKQYD